MIRMMAMMISWNHLLSASTSSASVATGRSNSEQNAVEIPDVRNSDSTLTILATVFSTWGDKMLSSPDQKTIVQIFWFTLTSGTKNQQTCRSCWRRTRWSTWSIPGMETTQIGPAGNFKIIVVLNIVSIISTHMSNVIKTTPTSTRVQVQKETENGMEDGICGEVVQYHDSIL